MRYCTLYLSDITDRASLHGRLAGALMLPAYYGRNLDALKDCLTDIREDTEITVHGYAELEERLGGYARAFRFVLEDTAAKDGHVRVTFL